MDAADALARLDRALQRAGEGRARDEVLGEILTGQASVFATPDAFLVCQLWTSDEGLEARAWLAGGDLGAIIGPLRSQAECWAKLNGARLATAGGRKGWGRVLRDYQGGDEIMKVLA